MTATGALVLRVLLWNAHANSRPEARRVLEALDRWVHQYLAQVIVLCEVRGCYDALRSWAASNGYRLQMERPDLDDPGDEHGDTAILIRTRGRSSVRVRGVWTKAMRRFWTVVRYGVRHEPRRHQGADLEVRDGRRRARIRGRADHWPTYGDVNKEAWEESYESAVAFLREPGDAFVAGDLNASWDQAVSLGRAVAGKVAGERPDWLVTNGTQVDRSTLGKAGSDHEALLFTVML